MTVKPINPQAQQQAEALAADNRKAEPDVTRILWFPDDHEVRLLEITEQVPINPDEDVHPFYFRASPQDNLPLPSSIALIRAEEIGKLKLPPEWGSWDDAFEL